MDYNKSSIMATGTAKVEMFYTLIIICGTQAATSFRRPRSQLHRQRHGPLHIHDVCSCTMRRLSVTNLATHSTRHCLRLTLHQSSTTLASPTLPLLIPFEDEVNSFAYPAHVPNIASPTRIRTVKITVVRRRQTVIHTARELAELSSAKEAMVYTCSEYWDMVMATRASGSQAPCILRAFNVRKSALIWAEQTSHTCYDVSTFCMQIYAVLNVDTKQCCELALNSAVQRLRLIAATNKQTLVPRVYRELQSLACCQINPRNTRGYTHGNAAKLLTFGREIPAVPTNRATLAGDNVFNFPAMWTGGGGGQLEGQRSTWGRSCALQCGLKIPSPCSSRGANNSTKLAVTPNHPEKRRKAATGSQLRGWISESCTAGAESFDTNLQVSSYNKFTVEGGGEEVWLRDPNLETASSWCVGDTRQTQDERGRSPALFRGELVMDREQSPHLSFPNLLLFNCNFYGMNGIEYSNCVRKLGFSFQGITAREGLNAMTVMRVSKQWNGVPHHNCNEESVQLRHDCKQNVGILLGLTRPAAYMHSFAEELLDASIYDGLTNTPARAHSENMCFPTSPSSTWITMMALMIASLALASHCPMTTSVLLGSSRLMLPLDVDLGPLDWRPSRTGLVVAKGCMFYITYYVTFATHNMAADINNRSAHAQFKEDVAIPTSITSMSSARLLSKLASPCSTPRCLVAAHTVWWRSQHYGGLNDHPSPSDALYRLRTIILGKTKVRYGQKQITTAAPDDSEFVASEALKVSANILREDSKSIGNITVTDDITTQTEFTLSTDLQENAYQYLCGWLARKIKPEFSYLEDNNEMNALRLSTSSWGWGIHVAAERDWAAMATSLSVPIDKTINKKRLGTTGIGSVKTQSTENNSKLLHAILENATGNRWVWTMFFISGKRNSSRGEGGILFSLDSSGAGLLREEGGGLCSGGGESLLEPYSNKTTPDHTLPVKVKQIQLLPWITCSHDISPNEHACDIVTGKQAHHSHPAANVNELWTTIQAAWQATAQGLIYSMPLRAQIIVAARGVPIEVAQWLTFGLAFEKTGVRTQVRAAAILISVPREFARSLQAGECWDGSRPHPSPSVTHDLAVDKTSSSTYPPLPSYQIWNYFPSIVTNFTGRMSLIAPVKIMCQAGAVTFFYGWLQKCSLYCEQPLKCDTNFLRYYNSPRLENKVRHKQARTAHDSKTLSDDKHEPNSRVILSRKRSKGQIEIAWPQGQKAPASHACQGHGCGSRDTNLAPHREAPVIMRLHAGDAFQLGNARHSRGQRVASHTRPTRNAIVQSLVRSGDDAPMHVTMKPLGLPCLLAAKAETALAWPAKLVEAVVVVFWAFWCIGCSVRNEEPTWIPDFPLCHSGHATTILDYATFVASILCKVMSSSKLRTNSPHQGDIINIAESIYSLIRRGEMKPRKVIERAAEMMKISTATVRS
ncbi:hypothetical protein PR048_002460 [Dryococelus australis]|uniref:Uncharacterized protein n=1 Tax=Dryococelus australis TaxID=614101 RepID=A0ABQ9ILP1_9NEOP|nr:hypothetical protein PR048_002460 [Dryococelus australis]